MDEAVENIRVLQLTSGQPVVGMFPPSCLLSAFCPPRSFDFHTVNKADLEEFNVPIEFVVSRTALIHGVRGLAFFSPRVLTVARVVL